MRRGHTLIDTYKDEAPPSFQNNFTAGLKTEFTGLNFPPNACTETFDCVFEMQGDVTRRPGVDLELHYTTNTVDRTSKAINSYHWLNAGGDGETQVYVLQIGSTIYFYESSNATIASPLSTQLLMSTIDLSSFLAAGSSNDPSEIECQFSDGNGYLFIYHPYCDPVVCTFSGGSINGQAVDIKTRDFTGYPEPGVGVNFRSQTLTAEHNYNLQNQGWTKGALWSVSVPYLTNGPLFIEDISTHVILPITNYTFTIPSGLTIVNGTPVSISAPITFVGLDSQGDIVPVSNTFTGLATVVSYTGTSLVLSLDTVLEFTWPYGIFNTGPNPQSTGGTWNLSSSNQVDLIDTWFTAEGNYPSNADVWWTFKNSSNVFDPATTVFEVPVASSPAPSGHFIVDAFNQQQIVVSGISGLTQIGTSVRPKTGAWFQGRVWYAGVDASQAAAGDQNYYTWTESIYFSQIVTDSTQFGLCYQVDDPTDENLFNILPSDGGVINIQGAGSIYKLFPMQNGMLVFAANGIWFLTGSTGIGFAANDYTITKISAVRSISSTSFVDVQGLPIFWNEEGIYAVEPAQQGLGLTVNPLTVGTIRSFYNDIPYDSKRYARGSYDPVNYILQWVYRSTEESSVTDRYQFDSILNLNTFTKAFYPWTVSSGLISGVQSPYIHDVKYVTNPGGENAPEGMLKYVCSVSSGGSYNFSFAEFSDLTYVDWDYATETIGLGYDSYFVTGYQLDGQGIRKWQPTYILIHSRSPEPSAYTLQGIWNFATDPNSGAYSSIQVINVNKPYHGMVTRRHRIRGHGYVLQMKVSSVDSLPFDIMGWSQSSTMQAGV
jgi:hypothetical protein